MLLCVRNTVGWCRLGMLFLLSIWSIGGSYFRIIVIIIIIIVIINIIIRYVAAKW